MRNRRDAGERFAAKPERANRSEVVGAGNLAGGVPLDRETRVLGVHPLAVILDAERLLPTELDGHRDPPRTGIECVLDELLHDRRGPLDDLAGGDLVGKMQREAVDAGHDSVVSLQSLVVSHSLQSESSVPVVSPSRQSVASVRIASPWRQETGDRD